MRIAPTARWGSTAWSASIYSGLLASAAPISGKHDQTVLIYDEPRPFDSENAEERTLLYCVEYDNGSTDPSAVKRKSTSPPVPGEFAPGGPCADADLVCLGGENQGTPCAGHGSLCLGGVCDACPVRGGVTTEDEMLLLMGGYHVRELPPR